MPSVGIETPLNDGCDIKECMPTDEVEILTVGDLIADQFNYREEELWDTSESGAHGLIAGDMPQYSGATALRGPVPAEG